MNNLIIPKNPISPSRYSDEQYKRKKGSLPT